MGKILPKKKFFKSSIYSPKLNVGSHIDNVRNSLENLIFANEKETERTLLKKRIKVVAIVTMFLMVIGSVMSPKGQAEVATFYPTACLGGWKNTQNAEGEPQTKSNNDEKEFSKENSAILQASINADIYCGSFIGNIEENTKPTKIIVSLAWSRGEDIVLTQEITGDSFASSSGEILDMSSTTEVSFTLSSSTEENASSSDVEINTSSTTVEVDTNSTTTNVELNKDNSSLLDKVIDIVGEVIGNVFGGGNEDATSTPNDTVPPQTETVPTQETITEPQTPQTEAPTNAPAVEVAPEPSPVSEPTPAPAPAPEIPTEPTSFINNILEKFATYFVNRVFAEEVATSSEENIISNNTKEESGTTTAVTTPEIVEIKPINEIVTGVNEEINLEGDIVSTSSTSTVEIDNSSTTESTSTESFLDSALNIIMDGNEEDESPNNFLEVLYTFDGVVWKSLGKVNEASMKYRTFEIPVTATTSWNDMQQLQIKVKPIQRIDVAPTVYLDGIKVEVLYETPVLHQHPDFSRDTILKDKSDEGVRVVSIINSDTNITEIWYTTTDTQGNYGVAPGTWVQVELDQSDISNKLIDIYGQNIFWVDEVSKLLWVTNLQKGTNDGMGLVSGASTTINFTKANGEDWIFEYNSLTKTGLVRIKI